MTIFRDVIKLICPVCGLNIEDEIHFVFDSLNIHQLDD